MKKLQGKRLLVLAGVNPIAEDVVKFARQLGVYTIVTGNLDVNLCPAKRYSDQNENVSTADLDELEKLIKKEKVDGVFTGSSEYSIERVISLCERLDLPFYCNREQWNICSNKDSFKNLCRKYNVPVVEEYDISDFNENNSSYFPVIVKPVDGSGGGGISIANNYDELKNSYNRALNYSTKKLVIIEKYITADEIGVSYAIQNGNVVLTAMHDRYLKESEGQFMKLPLAYIYPSKHLEKYQKYQNEKVIEMFKSINLQNGTLFLQGFALENSFPFYEMGLRFNGAKQYNILKEENNFSTMDMMINYALTGETGEKDITQLANPNFKSVYCTLSILGKLGKIKKVIGVDELNNMKEVLNVSQWYYGGEEITDKYIGTQRQILCRVTLKTPTHELMAEAIEKVYEEFDVISDNDESMIIGKFDYKKILKSEEQ